MTEQHELPTAGTTGGQPIHLVPVLGPRTGLRSVLAMLLASASLLSAPVEAAARYRVFAPAPRMFVAPMARPMMYRPYVVPMMRPVYRPPVYRPYVAPVVRPAVRPFVPAYRPASVATPRAAQPLARSQVYRPAVVSTPAAPKAGMVPAAATRPSAPAIASRLGGTVAATAAPALRPIAAAPVSPAPMPAAAVRPAPVQAAMPAVAKSPALGQSAPATPGAAKPAVSANATVVTGHAQSTPPVVAKATTASSASTLLNSNPVRIASESLKSGLGSVASDAGKIAAASKLPAQSVSNLSKAATAAKVVGVAADGVRVYSAYKTGGPHLTDRLLAGGSELSGVIAVKSAEKAGSLVAGPAGGAAAGAATSAAVNAANTYIAPKLGSALYNTGSYPGAAADAKYLQQSAADTARMEARLAAQRNSAEARPARTGSAEEMTQMLLR